MITRTILPLLALLATIGMSVHGQGRVHFNNVISWNAIDVCCSGVYPGVYPGGDYSIQLLWAPGTNYGTRQQFYSALQGASFPVSFWGATGGSPLTDGAGLFDGGTVAIGSVGTYTMMARGWYNGGQYPTYDVAEIAGVNAGQSQRFVVNVTASPAPANVTTFPSFTIGQLGVPSPPPPPRLAIIFTNGQTFVSWPYNPAYNLQATTNLASDNWLDVPGPFPVVNGRNVVTNAVFDTHAYFRLRR